MKKLVCAIVAICFLTTGCSALVADTQKLNVTCSEADATVQVNGGKTFAGKAQVEAVRNRPLLLACYKHGYFPSQKVISNSLSGTGIADLIGSFILVFPAFGLFTPGAWKLDESDVTLEMVKD